MVQARVAGTKRVRRAVWWQAAVAAAALAYFGVLHLYGVNLGEEGATVFLLYRTARGEVPYIDFISGYTPAYFYFHALLFRWFGEHLSVVRLPLVAVHVVNALLLFRVGLHFAPPAWSVVPVAAYAALLPVVEVSELSFNVPYPAWYCIAWMLSSWLLLVKGQEDSRGWRWLSAGLLAGLSFSFKPNSGLFQLAFTATAAAGLLARRFEVSSLVALLAVATSVAAVFRHHLLDQHGFVFLGPFLLAVVAWIAVALSAQPPTTLGTQVGLRALLLAGAGFLSVTLPWLAVYWWKLGFSGVWRDVLFVGSGYEEHFFIPYEWSWLLFLVAVALSVSAWWLPLWLRGQKRQEWSVAILVVVIAMMVAYAALAPKPEGAEQAVISAVRRGLYIAVPTAHFVAAVGTLLLGVTRRWQALAPRLALLNIGAQALFWTAYPRSDFFHLAYAAPLSLVLLVVIGQAYSRRWARALPDRLRELFPALVPAAALAVLLVCSAPQLRVWSHVVGFLVGLTSRLEWWDTDRALVLVRADHAGQRQRDFAHTARWLLRQGARGEELFTFPDLDLLGFLVATWHPARIGYFKSGWPGHSVEAEVVDDLQRRPPRWIVTEYPPSLFFADAAGFFFLLKHWVEQRYAVQERFGSFRVWRPQTGASVPADGGGDSAPHWKRWERKTASEECNRQALLALRGSPDPVALEQWSRAWAEFGYRTWSTGCARLVLRIAGEQANARVGAVLARVRPTPESPLYTDWANALWNVAVRNLLLTWQFGGADEDAAPPAIVPEEWADMRSWFLQERDPRLRIYLAWRLAARAPIELLWEALAVSGAEPTDLASVLERGLLAARLSSAADQWAKLASRFVNLPAILPPLFLDWARLPGSDALRVIRAASEAADPATRALSAYLTVPLGQCAFCPLLRQLLATDPDASVHSAARWARRHLGCESRCTSSSDSR
ncbi:MAG: glycosyltransferase family 39 protein [Candidatus Binatia bacterium]|nr:glycosyltransferase family 39 protein [Candidatus Binatia bacterium]